MNQTGSQGDGVAARYSIVSPRRPVALSPRLSAYLSPTGTSSGFSSFLASFAIRFSVLDLLSFRMVSVDGSQILARKYLSPYRLKTNFDLLLSVGLCLMVLNVTALPFLAWRMVNVPDSFIDSIRYSPFGMRLLPTIKSNGISALILTVSGAANAVASNATPKLTAAIRLIIGFFIFFLLRIGRPDGCAGRGFSAKLSVCAVDFPSLDCDWIRNRKRAANNMHCMKGFQALPLHCNSFVKPQLASSRKRLIKTVTLRVRHFFRLTIETD